MRVLSITHARSIWLLPTTEDINPRGRSLRDAAKDVGDRYEFATLPTAEQLVRPPDEGIKFLGGTFTNDSGTPIAVDLTIHPDGLIFDSRSSTDDSDSFANDMVEFLSAKYGLPRQSELDFQRLYLSVLHVHSEAQLERIGSAISTFSKSLSAALQEVVPDAPALDPWGVQFGTDPSRRSQPMSFRFERANGVAFEKDRYFSSAPLPTATHLGVLSEFERLLQQEVE